MIDLKKTTMVSSLWSLVMAHIFNSNLSLALLSVTIVIAIDTITGVAKAIKNRSFSSAGFSRLFAKIFYLYGSITALIVLYKATSIEIFRTFIDAVIVLIIINELFSVAENVFEINSKTKEFVRTILEEIKFLKKQ